jgi:hypothetical protein
MKSMLPLFAGLFLLATTTTSAQDDQLPAVFQLGENEQVYEQLTTDYSLTLLEVANFDAQSAFSNWLEMMLAMEAHADKIKFDMKGVKLWMHVFWNADGTIQHIGYMLRPDSRNVSALELSAFLKTFMKKYQFPLSGNKSFNHYTGANFPVYSEKVNK